MKNQMFKQLVSYVGALALAMFAVLPAGAQSATATLFYSPSTETAALNQNFSIDIRVNTASQNVVGVDAVFIYDPTYLGTPTVDANSGIPSGIVLNMGNQGTTADGKIKYDVTWLAQYGGGSVMNSATGRVATISFKALKLGTTTLTFSQPDSTISDSSGNDLIAATGHGSATITISNTIPSEQTLTSVSISPASATVAPSGTQGFTATALGQNGTAITSGVTFAWALPTGGTSYGTISPASGGSTTFTAGSATGNTSLGVTATQGTTTKTANAAITISTSGPFVPGPGGTNPFITSVVPSSGHKDVMQQVTINGGNFANYQADKSKVYVGLVEATIIDWNTTRIVAQFPTNEAITKAVTLTVRVLTSEDKEATYLGYTYTTGSLPGSGPETWAWAAVILAALGLSVLTYRKFSYNTNQAVSSYVTRDGTEEDLYRF